MISMHYRFYCDNPDCISTGRVAYFSDRSHARNNGWVISHDRRRCYCPRCGVKYKHVGRNPDKKIDSRDGRFFEFNCK